MNEEERLIRIDRTHPVPADWLDQVELASFQYRGQSFLLEREARDAFEQLRNTMLEHGFILGAASAYRSREEQNELYEEMICEKGMQWAEQFCALPGYSEHQTGLAVDIEVGPAEDTGSDEENLPDCYFYRSVFEHLAEFGFILRYPEGKESITGYSFEPWHIRYVGSPHAEIMCEKNWTLEEYLEERKDRTEADRHHECMESS